MTTPKNPAPSIFNVPESTSNVGPVARAKLAEATRRDRLSAAHKVLCAFAERVGPNTPDTVSLAYALLAEAPVTSRDLVDLAGRGEMLPGFLSMSPFLRSIMNRPDQWRPLVKVIADHDTQGLPRVGDVATLGIGSDRYSEEVRAVDGRGRVLVGGVWLSPTKRKHDLSPRMRSAGNSGYRLGLYYQDPYLDPSF